MFLPVPGLPTVFTEEEKRALLSAKTKNTLELNANKDHRERYAICRDSLDELRHIIRDMGAYDWEAIFPFPTQRTEYEAFFEEMSYEVDAQKDAHLAQKKTIFFTHLEKNCAKYCGQFARQKCKDCRDTETLYYMALLNNLTYLGRCFGTLFSALSITEPSPPDFFLAAQSLILDTALVLVSVSLQQRILNQGQQTSDHTKYELTELPNPMIKRSFLYASLYSIFLYFNNEKQELTLAYQRQIKKWGTHLRYISRNTILPEEALSEALFQHIMEELYVFGIMTEDIVTLSESFQTNLPRFESILASDPPLPGDKKQHWQHDFNEAMLATLETELWFDHSALKDKATREIMVKFLTRIENIPFISTACLRQISQIQGHWAAIDQEYEEQRQAAQKLADNMLYELEEKEKAVEQARKQRKQQFTRAEPKGTKATGQGQPLADKDNGNGKNKKQPLLQAPLPQWLTNWNSAKKEFEQKNYYAALELLNSVRKKAPESEQTAILVEMADASLLLTKKARDEIQKLQMKVALYHSSYAKAVEASKEKRSMRLLASKEDLMTVSNRLIEAWQEIEATLEQGIELHEKALNKLDETAEGRDSLNRDVIVSSIDLLNEFNSQTVQSRGQLIETFQLRSQWLSTFARHPGKESPESEETISQHPRKSNGKTLHSGSQKQDSSQSPPEMTSQTIQHIPTLLRVMKKQQTKHVRLYNKSDKVYKASQTLTVQQASGSRIPHSLYRRFNVDRDGDCLFSSIAIALNNILGTTHRTAHSTRVQIHNILKRVITMIGSNGQMQQELSTLLGVSFGDLQAIVTGEVLLQGPPTDHRSSCQIPMEQIVLQQYGEINFLLLLQLEELLPTGIQLPGISELQTYNLSIWLSLAPNLLTQLVQQQVVDISHWSAQLQQELVAGNTVPEALADQIENTPFLAIISHQNEFPTENPHIPPPPVYDHFEVSVLDQQGITRIIRMAGQLSIFSIFILQAIMKLSP